MKTYFDFNPCSERIKLAHRRLAAAYARKVEAAVPVVEPLGGMLPSPIPIKDRFDDNAKMLTHSVAWANALALLDNDWPPFLDAYCTVPMVPEAFGTQIHFRENDIAATPVTNDIEDMSILIFDQ